MAIRKNYGRGKIGGGVGGVGGDREKEEGRGDKRREAKKREDGIYDLSKFFILLFVFVFWWGGILIYFVKLAG